jgi:hypothetical protein
MHCDALHGEVTRGKADERRRYVKGRLTSKLWAHTYIRENLKHQCVEAKSTFDLLKITHIFNYVLK